MRCAGCVAFLTIVIGILGGCTSSIVGSSRPPSVSDDARIGVVYYLPKGLIPITITAGDAVGGGGGAGAAPPQPGGAQVSISNTIASSTQPMGKAEEPSGGAGAREEPTKADASKSIAFTPFYSITVGEPSMIADATHTYFLSYNPDIASDDDVAIAVGSNGLLQSVNATSTDRSGAIAVKIAELIGEIAKVPVAFGGLGFGTDVTASGAVTDGKPAEAPTGFICGPRTAFQIKALIDPDALADSNFAINTLENELESKQAPIKIRVTRLFVPDVDPTNPPAAPEQGAHSPPEDDKYKAIWPPPPSLDKPDPGVYLRSSRPYLLHIEIKNSPALIPEAIKIYTVAEVEELRNAGIFVADTEDELARWKVCEVKESSEDVIVMLPNEAPVWRLDVSRATLVTKKTEYTLANGMLTKVAVNKPSELLAGLQIPIDFIKELISIPAELLTLRIQQMQDTGTLTADQVALIEAQIKLIRQQQELDRLRQSLGTQPGAPPATAAP